ncbi:MAG: metallophosphoesterase [Candidatus Aminicenantes bacterium]|nr:MAG: metallophosphoesterase [Candidatus Aminicenantes bacterium]
MGLIKLLFLADTHLGFDYPFRPRIQRRRRGQDFFANYQRALEPARKLKVDAIVHGGDLLFRSRVPARLVDMAFAPLKEIADKGIKVYIVPGNHERSKIPFKILSLHPNIHIFDSPRTFVIEKKGLRVALSGFPYCRESVRAQFPRILQETGWREFQKGCDGHILCVHHCFEGAKVGPVNYTFRYKEDVIRVCDVPREFTAVLAGHIHRYQILTKDLTGRSLSTPVYYPGSIERTSFAEKDEKKGYFMFKLAADKNSGLSIHREEFVELPARPMVKVNISPQGMDEKKLKAYIHKALKSLSPQSIVKLDIQGFIPEGCLPALRASALRELAPNEMNISVKFVQMKKTY